LQGPSGLLNIPSAEMQQDGTFYTGINFLSKKHVNSFGGNQYNCLAYFFDLTFLPFIEINFRSTHKLIEGGCRQNVDRMFSGKFRVAKERKYLPSIALGANDLYTSSTGCGNQYFGVLYCVLTKNIFLKSNQIGLTSGYAYEAFRNNLIKGVFFGVSFEPSFIPDLKIIIEYDSNTINMGFNLLILDHFYMLILSQNFDSISGGVVYKLNIK
jgi:hypothetical protein